MQVSVQVGEGLKREMRVDLPADDIEAEIDKRLQRFARSARIPGFRPGKVPAQILRQQYGKQLRDEIFGEMVQSTFPTAVRQEQLDVVGLPVITPDIDQKARRYAYKAVFEVLPVVELQPFAGTKIRRPVCEITESDIDTMIDRLRKQRLEWKEVERGAREGDQVKVAFKGSMDGKPFEGGTAENFPIQIGSEQMMPGFEEQLLGATAGEVRDFDLRFPEDYHAQHLAGQQAHFDVSIDSVSEPLEPEVDEAFVRDMGVSSGDLADFRADVRVNMEREMRRRINDLVKARVMDALIEANTIDLPEAIINQEASAMREMLAKSASSPQVTLPDAFYADMARRRVAIGFLIGEATKSYGLSVDEGAVRAKINELAAGYDQPHEFIDYYQSNQDRLSQVQAGLLEEMVVARLLEDAQVEDETKSFFELTESRE